MYVYVYVYMVYTVLIHHALLVISIINGFTAAGALRYSCVWFFLHIYTSTLKSLFTIILGLKTKCGILLTHG